MTAILVVDDSLTDRRLAGGLIARHGDWQVHYANDGKAALDSIELHLPEIVLTDLQMPEMNGLELVRTIRTEYPLIPVILMTAVGSEVIAVDALRAGAASYVPKERLSTDLQETIERVLAISQSDRAQARLVRRMKHQRLEFELENDFDLISSMVQYLQSTAFGMGVFDEGDRVRVGVALQEALVNACFHGNLEVSSRLREENHHAYYDLAKARTTLEPFSQRRIHISAEFAPTEAVFVIRDEGPGFDPRELPDPTDPLHLEKPSGRGLLLMRTFMDAVEYNSTGNQVTLIKRRPSSSSIGSAV
jgi:CheY-like chemotaxis protein